MKLIFLACFLVGFSAAKISPFVPGEIAKHEVDAARINFMKEKKVEAEAMKAEQEEAKVGKNIAEEMSEVTDEPEVPGDWIPFFLVLQI